MGAVLHPDDLLWFQRTHIPKSDVESLFARHLPSRPVVSVEEHPSPGCYHKIFFVDFTSGPSAVLRVARPCFPPFKIENEVAVLKYVREKTNMKDVLPEVYFWNSQPEKEEMQGFGYLAMEKMEGKILQKEWRMMESNALEKLLEQMAEMWIQLRNVSFGSIVGGLELKPDGNIEPGRMVEETMWQYADIERYWWLAPTANSFDQLNISGPYPSYISYLAAHLLQYSHNIALHPSMTYAQAYIPRIEALVESFKDESRPWTKAAEKVKCYLGHCDPHMGNILFQGDKIAGFIDWEFAGLVPSWRTDPTQHVIYEPPVDASSADDSRIKESRPMEEIWTPIFKRIVEEKAPEVFRNNELRVPEELVYVEQIRTYLRCILEVVPRNDEAKMKLAKGGGWEAKIEEGLTKLGF